jgi:hypothetical protein
MKLRFHSYAFIVRTQNNCIQFKFNNDKTVYKHMALHKVTEFYTLSFSVWANITSKFRRNAIFKSSAKENYSNKNCRYVHGLSLYKTSFV